MRRKTFFLIYSIHIYVLVVFFFFNDTATTEIYTLSLHDALPIWAGGIGRAQSTGRTVAREGDPDAPPRNLVGRRCGRDRKSTRLNSSHLVISYAVFCLKKKKQSNGPSAFDGAAYCHGERSSRHST